MNMLKAGARHLAANLKLAAGSSAWLWRDNRRSTRPLVVNLSKERVDAVDADGFPFELVIFNIRIEKVDLILNGQVTTPAVGDRWQFGKRWFECKAATTGQVAYEDFDSSGVMWLIHAIEVNKNGSAC